MVIELRHRGGIGETSAQAIARTMLFAAALAISATTAWPEEPVGAVTDNITYDVGAEVRLKVLFPRSPMPDKSPVDITATIRYAGESKPIVGKVPIASSFIATKSDYSTGYRTLWKIPSNSQTGRYEVDLVASDPKSRKSVFSLARAATFAVHRKLVRIERVELDKTFYTSGDAVACKVVVRNQTAQPLAGVLVEFSKRYWPWIAPPAERDKVDVFPIVSSLALKPSAEVEVRSATAAVAKQVKETSVEQYGVVLWDRGRKSVLDIAFSPLVFIQPPGGDARKPYPLQYVFPNLESVDTTGYRKFKRVDFGSTAVQFDHRHTMFASGAAATLKFTVTNSTDSPWRGTTIRASLRSPEGTELARQVLGEKVDLAAQGTRLERQINFTLPVDESGVYRAVVEVSDPAGETLAEGQLELAANPLPKSVLIFCAHEDDEMAHAGMISAAAENQIPLHLVYFTSGDAGSCDRYYQRSCGPAEALNFGGVRVQEAQAALAHLGVPREDIMLLGLPDGGLGEIWSRHVEPANPYMDVLLATGHAPYENLVLPNLPYARKSVVETVKQLIKKFHPEVIYTGHPDERHVDHRTNNWFVVKALQELLREGAVSPTLTLLTDQVYGPGPQAHAPYQYKKHLLYVSGEAAARTQEAGWFYQSQGGNRALGKLRTFDQLRRQEIHWQVLDWKEHEGWNERN